MAPRLAICLLLGGALALPQAQAMAASPPQVDATYVTEVTATSANLRAEVNAEGQSTTYRFDYLTLAQYEANLKAAKEPFAGALKAPPGGSASAGSSSEDVLLTQHLTGLSPATLYRFRAVATNASGTTTGTERGMGTEEASNAFALLDNRGWEMVSPPDKNGGEIQEPEAIFGGGDFQAAADGQSITYSSADSFAGGSGAPPGSQYMSSRSGSGWSTENVTAPLRSGGYGNQPNGVPYQLFSADLSRALMLDPHRCPEGEMCARSYSLRDGSGAELADTPEEEGLAFEGASADLHHLVFASDTGLYGWSGEGGFTLLSATAGASLAASGGAISQDGARVYFVAPEDGPITLHEAGHPDKPIAATIGGGASFQTASADGRYAFFTKGAHLIRWDSTNEAEVDLTPSGEVKGMLGASADGSKAYYLANTGLYEWSNGTTTKVAAAAATSDYPPATGTSRVSADGAHLLFLSAATLTGYESNGATELFLYGPPAGGGPSTLLCVSCNPTGERAQGSASIPGALADGQQTGAFAGYKPRVLSSSAERVFFTSRDRLAIQDTSSAQDVYEWETAGEGSCTREGGCVQLISSGHAANASTFIDASADGSDVFFRTDASLAYGDPGSYDLYDAREGGGFPSPPNAIACEGDACQPLPEAPEDPPVGTLVANGGNPAARFTKFTEQKKKGKPKHKKHHGKHKHKGKGR